MNGHSPQPIPIRLARLGVLVALLAVLVTAGAAFAQGITTAGLGGRVTNEGQGLPGVTVEAKSPALQGTRVAVTSNAGDYVFVGLPAGEYTVTFRMQGFDPVTKNVSLATSQKATLDTKLNIAGVTAEAVVTGRTETVSTTTQASTTLTTELTQKLPITRTVLASVALSSGVTQTGPNNAFSIAGAQSFDNVFTVDGAIIQDNVRNTPNNLFVEDAVQETTTSVSGISAQYGRFTGGVVNTITKSGGNTFSGSFRTTLTNDSWSAITPAKETRAQKVNPRYEATLGGPIWKDRIWFFGSGRLQNVTASDQTSFTAIPFETGNDEKRYQGKLTITPLENHSLTGSYLKVDQEQKGNYFGVIMDLDSLVTRQLPQDIITVNYNGTLSSNFFVEGLYSRRTFAFENSGSRYTDLIKGTLMRDLSKGRARYNSPTFCGVCDPERRDNRDYLLKGTYFLSTPSLGSHEVVVGYDNFSGTRKANNYQSGSNYRMFTTSTIFQNGDIFPVIGPTSYVYYTPIDTLSKGTDALTHSVFLNDQWRLMSRLSFNLGIRWDKNNAKDSRGIVTANDSAFSPRLAAAFDVSGKDTLKVSASYARYIGGIQDNLVDNASNAGAPSTYIWYYAGTGADPINVNPPAGQPLVTRAAALQKVFDWFFAQGCPNLQTCRLPLAYASAAGVSTQIRDTLKSPYADEYVLGFNGALGRQGSFRVDFVRRKFGDFYNRVLNTTTGRASDPLGNSFDLGIVGNTNSSLVRNYTALQTQLQFRTGNLFVGGNWTWSHTLGNFDGEAANTGPVPGAVDVYPEYKDPSWNNPRGDLASDQRHRVRLFASYDLPMPGKMVGLNIAAVQAFESGVPYGAVGAVRSRLYVTNPGYLTPPSSVTYYYTARDAYRTDNISRTDLALNMSFRVAGTVELFFQPQVTNVFNNQGLLALDTTVRTRVTSSTIGLVDFNPFTTAPVECPQGASVATCTAAGANWQKGPNFGRARNVNDYQAPRTFLVSAGVRF